MDGKKLLGKMELIAPEFIEAADKAKKKKPIKWQHWTALAACLAVSVLSGVLMAVDPSQAIGTAVISGDTASMFSGGGIAFILLVASLLAAIAIAALIIKDKRE